MGIDLDLIAEMVQAGYISRRIHPQRPDISIYNYTKRTQIQGLWNEATRICRGLILSDDGEIIARPFPKFFNLEETDPADIPAGPFRTFDKEDGSLGILYHIGSKPAIATRGSFDSRQAIEATTMLHGRYHLTLSRLDPCYTYLFEIIYPENRIIIDYGRRRELILLGIIETATGKEVPLVNIGFRLVQGWNGFDSLEKFRDIRSTDREGFVLKWPNGFRVKVKVPYYKDLAYRLNFINTQSIWEDLKEGRAPAEAAGGLPDHFVRKVSAVARALKSAHAAILAAAHKEMPATGTRKEKAGLILGHSLEKAMFCILSGKDPAGVIWKMVKPEYQRLFNIDLDAFKVSCRLRQLNAIGGSTSQNAVP